jgi:hypothetical protein
VIDVLAARSPTIGGGLRRVARYFSLVDPRAVLELSDDDPASLALRGREPGLEVPPPAQGYTLAALVCRVVRMTMVHPTPRP